MIVPLLFTPESYGHISPPGKITVLQLSALLKQADSSKHKLTLTRLSSAPIPFTVISLSGNPWNEDLLAVCGLKECHVLTFNSGGEDCNGIFILGGRVKYL